MDDLVTRMMNAYFAASKTPYSYPPNICDGMTAALRVALDEVLRDPTTDELRRFNGWDTRAALCEFIRERRARIERPKSPEERVTVRLVNNKGMAVYDGDTQIGPWFVVEESAEIFRLGLIEKLKQESRKE